MYKSLETFKSKGDAIPSVKGIDKEAKQTYLMFNNCYGSFAVENAIRMREILK